MRGTEGERGGAIGKEIFIFAIKWALNNVALGLRAAQIAVGSKSRTGKCCPQWAGGSTGCRLPGPRVPSQVRAKDSLTEIEPPNMSLVLGLWTFTLLDR